jgi:glycerol dehydrogenase
MRNNAPILLGAGDFIQGPGVLDTIGSIVGRYGRKALIVAGETAWQKTEDRIAKSFEKEKISFETYRFTGYCSDAKTDEIAQFAKDWETDIIVGVGGGKCLDSAKWSSDKAGLRVVTVPTSVATCAAYVSLCVLYDDTGSTIASVFTEREVGAVVLDTQLIATACPSRMFASGIADALAKEPELFFSIRYSTDWEKSVLPDLGFEIASFNTKRYFGQGVAALRAVESSTLNSDVEDVACTNVALTGMVSCLASGGKQLAIAHSIYDCICTHFKPQRAEFLHGEIVSCGIPVQMAVNGYDGNRIHRMIEYLKQIGTPTCLRDIHVEPTKENVKKILDYVFRNMGIEDSQMRELIETRMALIC